MFIITIKVPYNEITSPNDYHKIIHTIFHKPTDNIKTPTFSVINEDFDGITINVYNDIVPVNSKYVIDYKEFTIDYLKSIATNNELSIEFKYAAIKQYKGKCISFNKQTERVDICEKVSRILSENGCNISTINYNHIDVMKDDHHLNTFPYGSVNAKVSINNYENFLNLLLNGIGRKKYLGLGFINVSQS